MGCFLAILSVFGLHLRFFLAPIKHLHWNGIGCGTLRSIKIETHNENELTGFYDRNHPITVKCSVDRRSVFPHDVVHAHIRIANQTQSHRCFAKFQLRVRDNQDVVNQIVLPCCRLDSILLMVIRHTLKYRNKKQRSIHPSTWLQVKVTRKTHR